MARHKSGKATVTTAGNRLDAKKLARLPMTNPRGKLFATAFLLRVRRARDRRCLSAVARREGRSIARAMPTEKLFSSRAQADTSGETRTFRSRLLATAGSAIRCHRSACHARDQRRV